MCGPIFADNIAVKGELPMKRYMVDEAALAHNIALLLEKAKGKTLWGVIKGNGYGLGVVDMARVLRKNGIQCFAVTELREIRALREAGFDAPILMMESTCNPDEVRQLLEMQAILSVGTAEDADVINEQARLLGVAAQAHVKIDTGMGRYGFLPAQIDTVRRVYAEHPNIVFSGIYTHFYDSADPKPTEVQFDKFMAVVQQLREAGVDTGMVHCCNSSAFLKYAHMHCDGARVGSALLGRVTVGSGTGLKAVGQCEAELEEIRTIPAGHTVGYGAGWVAKRQTRIAVLSVGYYNGFAVDRGYDLWRFKDCVRGVARYIKAFVRRKALYVTVNGHPCRVLGHVGMVNMVIDVTDCRCKVGDMALVDINPLLLKGVQVVYF